MSEATVLLRLSGPLQAWGTDGYWESRGSLPRPTKSGVVGMVANALGRDYTDDVSDLSALRFSVRADRPGHRESDYQTAGGGNFTPLPQDFADDPVLAADPTKWRYGIPRGARAASDGRLLAPWKDAARETVLITKTYIVDAAFVVGLTGDAAVVADVAAALEQPARPLFLGRKNCVLSAPPLLGVVTGDDWFATTALLDEATEVAPHTWRETKPGTMASESSPEQPMSVIGDYRALKLTQGVVGV